MEKLQDTEKLGFDYSRFNNLTQRREQFLKTYRLFPPEERHSIAAELLAQHCDASKARELLRQLRQRIKEVYQEYQETGKKKGKKVEGGGRERIESLKREYIERLMEISVWPGGYSNEVLASRFQDEWRRGLGVGKDLSWLYRSVTGFHEDENGYGVSGPVVYYLQKRIGLDEVESLRFTLAALSRDLRDTLDPDSPIFKVLLLERVWHRVIVGIDDIFKQVLAKFAQPNVRIIITNPSLFYDSKMKKVAFLSAVSSSLRKTTLEILEKDYPDEEERAKVEAILRGILYLNTQRVTKDERCIIRRKLVEFLQGGDIDGGIAYLRELFIEDPFILPVAGGLALGFELPEIIEMRKEYSERIAKMEAEEKAAREEERRKKEEDERRRIIEEALKRNASRWELKGWAESLKGTEWMDSDGKKYVIGGLKEVRSFMKADIFDVLDDDQRKSLGVLVYIYYPNNPQQVGHAYYCPLTVKEKVEGGEWRPANSS